MSLRERLFVDVRNGSKITYSESDLRKIDRTYEIELLDRSKKKILSPFKKEPQRSFVSQLRDYAFEEILDKHIYTFKHILVIPNPYGITRQVAMILFNSSKETKVRYRVCGKKGEDFVAETEYTTRHRILVMGLYLNTSNHVDLEMIDRDGKVIKRRHIRIYVPEGRILERDIVRESKKEDDFHLMTVFNGEKFNPSVFDSNGDVRYSIQLKTNRVGMIPLKNGNFLFADRTANCVNKFGKRQPCRYHEMDYLGRVYRTFIIDRPVGMVAEQTDNSLFILSASDVDFVEDMVFEIDMNSGDIVKSVDLRDICGDKYRTYKNWTKITSIEYRNGILILVLRRESPASSRSP